MTFRRAIVTEILLSLVAGALADCSISGTTTIQSEADATALASCTTLSGSIAIATHFAGDISLDNIKTITGTLSARNVRGLTGLSGDSLEEIGTFHLEDLLLLNTLNFPHLTSVDTISWSILNDLSFLSFMDGISKAKDVNIQYTFLNSLEGLAFEEVDTLSISHNNCLQNIEMPLTRVTKDLYLYANSNKLAVVFDDLQWAYNVTITNARTISLPSLTSVNGSVGFYATSVDELTLENLETIGGALAISSNPDLTDVSLPALRSVCGGFFIDHNPQLQELYLDALTSICGALRVSGNLSSVSFNSLNDVGGAFSLTSSQDGLDCSPFDALHEDAWSNKDYLIERYFIRSLHRYINLGLCTSYSQCNLWLVEFKHFCFGQYNCNHSGVVHWGQLTKA
ncbi:Cell surface GPI-anchored protein ECM33 [Lasiodiplodia hormozganensis]|uniref:Cell surface GPI-anchored protein ECM33 n=2 Tax=Lasiodiplodia TaxID=66739 RepID=A0A5N5CWX0_9PEZI|nr:Cell surface GPI-anchored protein ECM33 [Lasiodiplodia theobromae]KAK0610291.1 Cell surface GPI-anchored protein ECM33 [Lasiodiplodia hormozganensis]